MDTWFKLDNELYSRHHTSKQQNHLDLEGFHTRHLQHFKNLLKGSQENEGRQLKSTKLENIRLKKELALLQQEEKKYQKDIKTQDLQVKALQEQCLRQQEIEALQFKELQKDLSQLTFKMKNEPVDKYESYCNKNNHCNNKIDSKYCQIEQPRTFRTSVKLLCTSDYVNTQGDSSYYGKQTCEEEAGWSKESSVNSMLRKETFENIQTPSVHKRLTKTNETNSGPIYGYSVVHVSPVSNDFHPVHSDMKKLNSRSTSTEELLSLPLSNIHVDEVPHKKMCKDNNFLKAEEIRAKQMDSFEKAPVKEKNLKPLYDYITSESSDNLASLEKKFRSRLISTEASQFLPLSRVCKYMQNKESDDCSLLRRQEPETKQQSEVQDNESGFDSLCSYSMSHIFPADLISSDYKNSRSTSTFTEQSESQSNSTEDLQIPLYIHRSKDKAIWNNSNVSNLLKKEMFDDRLSASVQKKEISAKEMASDPLNTPMIHTIPVSSEKSAADKNSIDSTLSSTGVTIGFNSNGLASVISFPERSESSSDDSLSLNSGLSQWSVDSSWSSTLHQTNVNHTAHNITEEKSYMIMKSIDLTNSEKNVTRTKVKKNSIIQGAKYFEEGIATQTREDIVCPGCGQVFPPSFHLQFLDHFEICHKTINNHHKKKCKSALKLRN